MLDADALRRARPPATTPSSIWPPTRTCASASSTRGATWSRTPSAPVNVLEAMRAARRAPDRLLLDRLGLRRARRLPHAGGVPVPRADEPLRSLQAGGGGPASRPTATGFGFQAWVFRFVSLAGRALLPRPRGRLPPQARRPTRHEIEVLGDGRQRKSYLYVKDCVEAMQIGGGARDGAGQRLQPRAPRSTARSTTRWTGSARRLGLTPRRRTRAATAAGSATAPSSSSTRRAFARSGWRPRLTIRDGVLRTVDYLLENAWLLASADARDERSPSTASGISAA